MVQRASARMPPVVTANTAFLLAAVAGLRARPKQISPAWLYDDLGSALFEAICALPWYRVSRAERALLDREAPAIARMCVGVDFVAELGPGSGEKLARLVKVLRRGTVAPAVHLVDVSPAALSLAERTLAREGITDISTASVEYVAGIDSLDRYRRGHGPALVAFLGSNIGNFHWRDAVGLLRRLRGRLRPGDRLLLGADLVKPVQELLTAYDDPLGVTAAFNKNLLVRMNHELGATFDVDAFVHRARWDPAAARVEMHLESRFTQEVTISAADLVVGFEAGETIWTESSYKFEQAQLRTLGSAVGFTLLHSWIDNDAKVALSLYGAE